jgi:hypothetical protein
MLPRWLTKSIEERRLRDAEARVQGEIARLSALQLKLQRLEARYENQLAAHPGVDDNGTPAPKRHEAHIDRVPAGVGGNGPISINSVSFEDLRDLGLSVTETTRILASRYRGELTSVSDLDQLPGLSRSAKETLKRRLGD